MQVKALACELSSTQRSAPGAMEPGRARAPRAGNRPGRRHQWPHDLAVALQGRDSSLAASLLALPPRPPVRSRGGTRPRSVSAALEGPTPPRRREAFTQEGTLYRFNIQSGHWGLETKLGRLVGWVRDGGPDLSGLRMDWRYGFTCEVEYDLAQENDDVSKGTVYLLSHEFLGPDH